MTTCITYNECKLYICHDRSYSGQAKAFGFSWNASLGKYVTPFWQPVAKMCIHPDNARALAPFIEQQRRELANSCSPWSDSVYPCPPGESYFSYQIAGIDYMVARKRSLNSDDMGLGKTIQAIGVCNALPDEIKTVLVICPLSMKITWQREFLKWSTSGLGSQAELATGSHFPESPVVIINYDILTKHPQIKNRKWDLLIIDEYHYLKNYKAQRSKFVLGFTKRGEDTVRPIPAGRVIAMSGTPLMNNPMEVYGLLQFLLPDGFTNVVKFGKRYCGGKKNHLGYWEFKGATNIDELQNMLRTTVMIRREKAQVAKEIPPKTWQVIEIEPSGKAKRILKKQEDIFGKGVGDLTQADMENIIYSLDEYYGPKDALFSLRAEEGLSKIDMGIQILEDAIGASGKVVCFCHHREVLRPLVERFGNDCVLYDGSVTSAKQRQKAIDRFQTDDSVKLFLGSSAAYEGITLTAAHHVVVIESPWNAAKLHQAVDRVHRIGQLENVLIQLLVLSGSYDAMLMKLVVHKMRVMDKALNSPMGPSFSTWCC